MLHKTEITKFLAEFHGLSTDENSINKLVRLYWVNPRKKEQGGLRLTTAGFDALTNADVESYLIKFYDLIDYTSQLILQLDNYMTCPWYITHKSIYVFNDHMAFQLALFSGDLPNFCRVKALTAQQKIIEAKTPSN